MPYFMWNCLTLIFLADISRRRSRSGKNYLDTFPAKRWRLFALMMQSVGEQGCRTGLSIWPLHLSILFPITVPTYILFRWIPSCMFTSVVEVSCLLLLGLQWSSALQGKHVAREAAFYQDPPLSGLLLPAVIQGRFKSSTHGFCGMFKVKTIASLYKHIKIPWRLPWILLYSK